MDRLQAHLARGQPPPTTPSVAVTQLAELLQQSLAQLPPLPHSSSPSSPPPPATAVRAALRHASHLLHAVSTRHVARFAELLSFWLLLFMLWRTCLYVKRRRKGLVGPALAPPLIKFWALYGVLECATQVVSLYLAALDGGWVVSVLRAAALAALSFGRRLPLATRLYHTNLVPFYDSYAPEIERLFAQARTVRDELNVVFREYAKYLLKRIEVGGLTGAMSDLRSEAQQSVEGQQPGSSHARGVKGLALPSDTGVFKSGRQFFAGAKERADAVASSSGNSMQGSFQVAAAEPPKPAYSELRALRRTFSSRKGQSGKEKEKEKHG